MSYSEGAGNIESIESEPTQQTGSSEELKMAASQTERNDFSQPTSFVEPCTVPPTEDGCSRTDQAATRVPQHLRPSNHEEVTNQRMKQPQLQLTVNTDDFYGIVESNEARTPWPQPGETTMMDDGNNVGSRRRLPEFLVRVVSTEELRDPSGAGYTAYLVRVQRQQQSWVATGTAHVEVSVVARRYSDFARLRKAISFSKEMRSRFPSKSLAGRLGIWTPAEMLAPAAAHDLVTYRKIVLEAWLVELTEERMDELTAAERAHVIEFLTVDCPPCQRTPVSASVHRKDDDDYYKQPQNKEEGNEHNNEGTYDRGITFFPRTSSGNSATAIVPRTGPSLHQMVPISFTLGAEIRKAANILRNMTLSVDEDLDLRSRHPDIPRNDHHLSALEHRPCIPPELIHRAWGLCTLTVAKAGLVFSGRFGTGLLISRSADGGWSAPCAVGTVGFGWGAQAGGDVTVYTLLLNTKAAVRAFAEGECFTLGASAGMAVGPIGRGATVEAHVPSSVMPVPAYSYAHSRGLFLGVSLEGAVARARPDVNARFYGRTLSVEDILRKEPRPKAAQPLYDVLEGAMDVWSEIRRNRPNGHRPQPPPQPSPNGVNRDDTDNVAPQEIRPGKRLVGYGVVGTVE